LSCKLHIDGEINGIVKSSNTVVIGKDGNFNGDLFSKKLIIKGVFDGNANCESIELLKDGKIVGKIISKDLMIESGSIFEGESELKKETKLSSASEDL